MKHCEKDMIMAQYDYENPYHYDGISEIFCKECGYREGRWCGKNLKPGEVEPPFCDGSEHPTFTEKL